MSQASAMLKDVEQLRESVGDVYMSLAWALPSSRPFEATADGLNDRYNNCILRATSKLTEVEQHLDDLRVRLDLEKESGKCGT